MSRSRKPKYKWLWLEEYEKCNCVGESKTKSEALGYCATHGSDRMRLTKIPMKRGMKEIVRIIR